MKLWGQLLGSRKNLDLSRISPEEIRRDEIMLEREEKKLDAEVEECQARIRTVTRETVDSGQKCQARVATRKILLLKERIADKEQALTSISKSLRALGRLRLLSQQAGRAVGSEVLARLQALPQHDLTRVLCGEMALREAREKGLDSILDILGGPAGTSDFSPVDEEERALFDALVSAQEAGDPSLATAFIADRMEQQRERTLELAT